MTPYTLANTARALVEQINAPLPRSATAEHELLAIADRLKIGGPPAQHPAVLEHCLERGPCPGCGAPSIFPCAPGCETNR